MSKVYLVRHGQSEANINKIWGGDYPLTELGKEQAATVSGNIPEKPDAFSLNMACMFHVKNSEKSVI